MHEDCASVIPAAEIFCLCAKVRSSVSAYFATCKQPEIFYLSRRQWDADLKMHFECVSTSKQAVRIGAKAAFPLGADVSSRRGLFPEEWNENVINS